MGCLVGPARGHANRNLCILRTSLLPQTLTIPDAHLSAAMINLLLSFVGTSLSNLKSRREFALEKLVLRQQLAVLKRSVKRPHARERKAA
ncbi:MAG: hypothetical protein A2289_05435 [Deltaproteobacteria bacterium RIFOXYA12_FULL_58_15]|nr:MAG: hypothetical protein A2289_05435 [Deltaproteobacteria bacterium RIFOXYA12_FULL_58_15]OGR09588.1 MAG: hypothetical protein A2341_16445 [Deltaproteobacteria bacterium RIFOXYB12_FULL_58_9]